METATEEVSEPATSAGEKAAAEPEEAGAEETAKAGKKNGGKGEFEQEEVAQTKE